MFIFLIASLAFLGLMLGMSKSNVGIGIPGVGNTRSADHRRIRRSGGAHMTVPGPATIDGSKSRDPLNTGDVDFLRAGLVMGRITASGKWAPSIIGVLPSAHTSSGTTNTSLSVGVANSVEILRRIGNSGTLKLTGPPSAAGSVAATAVTFSNVNTSTGVLTITDIAVNKIAGTFITPDDGSEVALALLDDGYPIPVVDRDDNDIDVEAQGRLLVGGPVDSSQIINWPSDTSLRTYLKGLLNDADNAGANFEFDDALTD